MSLLQKLAPYRISRYFKICFLLWDLFLLNAAIAISLLIRYDDLQRLDVKEVRTVSLLANLIWIFLLFYKDYYRTIRIERVETILMRTIQMVLIHIGFISVIIVLLKYSEISRLRMLYFYVLFFVFLLISRVSFMKLLKSVRAKGYNYKNVIIVGANESGENIRRILSKDLTYGYRIMGFFDENIDPKTPVSLPILGGFDAIQDFIIKENVDEMYIALHIDNLKIIHELTALCERYMVRIKFIPDFQQYTKSRKVEITFYGNTPVLMLRKEPLESTFNLLLKKAFDLCFSGLVIVLIFPWLFPIVMILIKLDSPGPIFFRQERSGRDNESFGCFKFRTMRVNGSANKKQSYKGDSRVTRVGAFLRKTSIDELPQFFNVFLGSMSVIGPRPHMLLHTEKYSELINHYLVRHYAKPGITGWAQVNGYRGETKELVDMEGRVDHDIWYIENWSFLLDAKIIYLTIYNMIRGEENAY
jgi:putative colanic acid biosynthesis UDP-glucose lipid carrier transferase